ncbi:hypothetical protein [Sphingopyxis sp. H115]|uniref:hypothetical protein n=1 Tax=Sphingopyxis sp. H115 TaxID=1759073 RepID=UPI000736F38C|nr:hypothetical protein [Sphingopyxis sp. H115]KTE17266.1 hypothetical protein ATE71_01690 [Sphingopyxis sp. H115]
MLSMTTALALAMQTAAVPAPPACPAGLAAGSARIWVYSAPSAGARKTAKLRPGSPLFICNANAGWLYVLYRDRRHSCPGTAAGLDLRYTSTCASGWLPRHRVAIVSR